MKATEFELLLCSLGVDFTQEEFEEAQAIYNGLKGKKKGPKKKQGPDTEKEGKFVRGPIGPTGPTGPIGTVD
jgi:hypothetical protein